MLHRTNPIFIIPEVLAESGPDEAVQELGEVVGQEEHPAEEVPGAEEGPGDGREENLEVEELFDNYDPNETSSFVGSVHLSKRWTWIIQPKLRRDRCLGS